MARETLFHILSRQPWWLSALVGAVLFGVTQLVWPPVAFFVALPFLILAAYIGFRQMRGTAVVDPAPQLEVLKGMSWDNFSLVIAEAYRRQGYTVTDARDAAYDFELVKNGRRTLLAARRWKVNSVGEGPLKALAAAVDRSDASNGICVAAGEFSINARSYATTAPVSLVSGVELVRLVARVLPRSERR